MKKSIILCFSVLFLVVIPIASAIGIAPGKFEVTPGIAQNYSFLIINNDQKDLYAKAGVESKYIQGFNEISVHINADTYEQKFELFLDIPKDACGTVGKVYLIESPEGENVVAVGKVMSMIAAKDCKKPFNFWRVIVGLATVLVVTTIFVWIKRKRKSYYF